jgi:CRISPR-associated endonuclease/helicase Cas3
VERVETPDDVLDGIAQTLAAGGSAAWVRNTVDDVLVAADLARARGLAPIVFHARFAQCDRQRIETQLMARFGPNSTRDERAGQLVMATQVIEQSLDLDFDQLATDLAPVDLLLQRAGRMRRHRRDRPGGCGEAMLLLSSEPIAEPSVDWVRGPLPGTAAVYRNHAVLWRTAREVMARGALIVPDDVRALVEAVHAGTEAPEALLASSMEAEGVNRAHCAQASHQLLDFSAGYVAGNVWENDLRIATRNIDASCTIRLARRSADGRIVPWAEPPFGDHWPAWQAWALSEVRLSGRLAKIGLASLPAHTESLKPVIAHWGRFERDLPVCVLEPDGPRWRGQMATTHSDQVDVTYRPATGLAWTLSRD